MRERKKWQKATQASGGIHLYLSAEVMERALGGRGGATDIWVRSYGMRCKGSRMGRIIIKVRTDDPEAGQTKLFP